MSPRAWSGNIRLLICGENAEWKTAVRIDCVGGIDRLGCDRVRSFRAKIRANSPIRAADLDF